MKLEKESDYNLNVEILEDHPLGAIGLVKGETYKAAPHPECLSDFIVLCDEAPNGDYMIFGNQAKVVK